MPTPTTRHVHVRPRTRRSLSALAVLASAVLVVLSVLSAPTAVADTVLGQFRNATDRCLENPNDATTPGSATTINLCGPATATAQQFSRWSDGSIRTPAGRCLDIAGGGSGNNTPVVLAACGTATSQRWTFRPDGTVQNQKANRCLAPRSNATAPGTPVVVTGCSTAPAQRWTVPAVSTPTTTTTTAPPTTTTTTTTTTTAPPTTTTTPPPTGTRDPLRQPFASSSIWNMPIGSAAVYVPANLPELPGGSTGARVPQIDDEPIVLTPTAPLTPVLASSGGWGGDRCKTERTTLATVPIPADYVLPSNNKNESASFLSTDGRTVVSTQPLARCTAGGPATSYVRYPDQDIYGPGIQGSHGGSGMSAL
ncbi:RICIN domain-containing protein, partial [Actinomycetospora lutea]|uniref:RICIN domain-containing protein n=1 Tax=Actinomycetospora lutea TaxID=663604 RepID=UPI002366094E